MDLGSCVRGSAQRSAKRCCEPETFISEVGQACRFAVLHAAMGVPLVLL